MEVEVNEEEIIKKALEQAIGSCNLEDGCSLDYDEICDKILTKKVI